MASRDVADGEGHGQNRQAKGKGDADKGYTEMRGSRYLTARGFKGSGENGAAATTEDKPEGSEELSQGTFRQRHSDHLIFSNCWFGWCVGPSFEAVVRT